MSALGAGAIIAQFPNFQPYHTGGGCMAMRHDLDDGGYLLVTDEDGCGMPTDQDEIVVVGRYDAEGHVVGGDDNTPMLGFSELEDWINTQLEFI